MHDKTVVRDHFGQYYTIKTYIHPRIRGSLKPKEFPDHHLARQFVQRLQVPTGYWQGLLNEFGAAYGPIMSERDLEYVVCERIVTGQFKVFAVNLPDPATASPKKRAIKTHDKIYHFAPAEVQLINKTEALHFNSADEAKAMLEKLNPDEKQLRGMAGELNVAIAANTSPAEISQAIADSMASGDTVVMVDNIASATPPSKLDAALAAATPQAGLGPEEEKKQEEKKEEKPCTLHKYTVECSHGRSVILDPASQKKGIEIPPLEVVSKSIDVDISEQEKIKVSLDLETPCASHEKEPVKVNNHMAAYIGDPYGKTVEFRAPSERLNIKRQQFRYVWLPSIKPTKYKITPSMGFCHTEEFNNKEKSVDLHVYPDIKWKWKTSINFGKLEFIPGKAKFEYGDFSIGDDSNVVLTYDGEKFDAKQKYEEYIKKPLDGFKKICDAIKKVLDVINDPKAALMRIGTQTKNPPPKDGNDNKDGNETRLIVQWPKLALDYDSTLIESDTYTYVDHDYSIKIKAKPLLDIDIQVDVLDSMISAAPYPVAKLMRYAKKRIEQKFDEDQEVGLRGELDIIFTVKSTVNITESEIKGRHNVIQHDNTVEPIKGDIKIPAKLKGAVRAEGKWFVISFSVYYTMKGETEWSGAFEFGQDDKGIYFSNTVEFKGIDVTLTKYEEVKAEYEADKEVKNDFLDALDVEATAESGRTKASVEGKDGKVEGKLVEEEKKRWSWLKPKEDAEKQQPKKYYIVEH